MWVRKLLLQKCIGRIKVQDDPTFGLGIGAMGPVIAHFSEPSLSLAAHLGTNQPSLCSPRPSPASSPRSPASYFSKSKFCGKCHMKHPPASEVMKTRMHSVPKNSANFGKAVDIGSLVQCGGIGCQVVVHRACAEHRDSNTVSSSWVCDACLAGVPSEMMMCTMCPNVFEGALFSRYVVPLMRRQVLLCYY